MAQQRSPWTIQKSVVSALILRELKTRFGANRLGYIWVPLEPALHLVFLIVVFTFVRQRVRPGVEFPVFLVVGVIAFLLFRNIALRTMESAESNKALFAYRQIKPMDTFIARVIFESALSIVVAVMTLFFLGVFGYSVLPASPLEFFGLHVLIVLFSLGLGSTLCVLVDVLPETRLFVRIIFMPLYLISGIVFPLSMVPPSLLPWLMWNPMLHFIELARGMFFPDYPILPGVSLPFVLIVTFVSLYIGLRLYFARRLRLVR